MTGGADLLASALAPHGSCPQPCADPAAMLAEAERAHPFVVRRVPLADLPRWTLGDTLAHDTGRFFSVEGVEVRTSFGSTRRWTQPIIQQPEIGVLGFLARRFGGVLHFLAQAKMEPDNRAMVQWSPTVQATPSNYLRVHGGRETPYLEHFLGAARGRVLVDTLQSEQGSRYFRKRNRNLVVELDDDVPVLPGFAWLTLGQIHALLARGNALNMNARTVLGCLGYAGDPGALAGLAEREPFRAAALASRLAGADDAELAAALSWLADRKAEIDLDVRRISLRALEDWIVDGESIRHASGRFFEVLGLEVAAANREVASWAQPALMPTRAGQVAMLCQRRAGVLHVLLQARAEAGFIDRVELGPTLKLSRGNYLRSEDLPPLASYLDAPADRVRLRAPQSEDGGRFFHDESEHLVIELPEGEVVDAPENFRWMTLGLVQRLLRRGYWIDIEARSLLACLA